MRNDTVKRRLDQLTIPEPSAGFEARILAAAQKTQAPTKTASVFSFPRQAAEWFKAPRFYAPALAACLALFFVVQTSSVSPTAQGVPLLSDISFGEEALSNGEFLFSEEDFMPDIG